MKLQTQNMVIKINFVCTVALFSHDMTMLTGSLDGAKANSYNFVNSRYVCVSKHSVNDSRNMCCVISFSYIRLDDMVLVYK